MKEREGARAGPASRASDPGGLSYANVMATTAVFIALGGSAWAVAASSVGTKQLKNNAVTAKKLKRNAVNAKHIRKEQVKAKHVAKNAVRTKHIHDAVVTSEKLAEGVAISGPKGDKGDSGFQVDCNEGLASGDVMVRIGSVCIDRYEASIWDAPSGGNQITGAIPCDANGQDCKGKIFARSVSGVTPRTFITWFQAQQALANSGKRLPTNAEWQMAVAGTPDDTGPGTTPCNTRGLGPVNTGSAAGCISDWGANDMVANVSEWVADWVPASTNCPDWGSFSDDTMCLSGASTTVPGPGALSRGGNFNHTFDAGPFAVDGADGPSFSSFSIGFRGAR